MIGRTPASSLMLPSRSTAFPSVEYLYKIASPEELAELRVSSRVAMLRRRKLAEEMTRYWRPASSRNNKEEGARV